MMIFNNNHFEFLSYLLHLCALYFKTAEMKLNFLFYSLVKILTYTFSLHIYPLITSINVVVKLSMQVIFVQVNNVPNTS